VDGVPQHRLHVGLFRDDREAVAGVGADDASNAENAEARGDYAEAIRLWKITSTEISRATARAQWGRSPSRPRGS
jgi:hypothetical protein